MTDTREEFDKWHIDTFGTKPNIKMRTEEENNDVFARYQGWQACEAHYKERIAELEKALNDIANMTPELISLPKPNMAITEAWLGAVWNTRQRAMQAIAESKE